MTIMKCLTHQKLRRFALSSVSLVRAYAVFPKPVEFDQEVGHFSVMGVEDPSIMQWCKSCLYDIIGIEEHVLVYFYFSPGRKETCIIF